MATKDLIRPIKKGLVDFFGNIRIYKLGLVVIGHTGYSLKGPELREILDIIRPGDIILNAHHNYVSSFFIKGDFGHVGLYVGDNRIIHVMTDGIRNEDILTFLRADDAAVVRPTNKELIQPAIDKAYAQLAKDVQYDYDFDRVDTEQFYCSEFTDFCYGYILKNGVSKDKSFNYPDDYLIPSEHYEIVWRKG